MIRDDGKKNSHAEARFTYCTSGEIVVTGNSSEAEMKQVIVGICMRELYLCIELWIF